MKLFDQERASNLMEAAGVDCLLATSKHNVAYLSDYWHAVSDDYYVLWDISVTHKTFCGVPADPAKEAFIVAGASETTTLEREDPWIKDRRYWGPGYYIQTWGVAKPEPGDPTAVVADALIEKGLSGGTIAVERRYLGVSYFDQLAERLPNARFVDAEEILWKLRMIKSPEEQRRLRECCRHTAEIWIEVMSEAVEGMTELEMMHLFTAKFAGRGMEPERTYVIFGPAGLELKNGSPVPSNNPLKEGQFIRIDVQGRYEGYVSNMSRVIGFGDVTPEMRSAQALVKSMVETLIPEVKPGMPVSEIRRKELPLYEGTGYDAVVPYTGHGVGRVVHEPPYLMESDPTVLEPGMSVTLEPTVNYQADGDIFVSLEDQFLVTEDGAEYLTEAAPLDLYL